MSSCLAFSFDNSSTDLSPIKLLNQCKLLSIRAYLLLFEFLNLLLEQNPSENIIDVVREVPNSVILLPVASRALRISVFFATRISTPCLYIGDVICYVINRKTRGVSQINSMPD
jgi:hypothetical protein